MTQNQKDAIPIRLSDRDNWGIAKSLLCDRIRRRWCALHTLTGSADASGGIDERLAGIGDDAAVLWRLFETLDRELELAFTPRSRRVAFANRSDDSHGVTRAEEFKAS